MHCWSGMFDHFTVLAFHLHIFTSVMTILPMGLSVYHLHAWSPWRPEEGSDTLVTEAADAVSFHVGAGK